MIRVLLAVAAVCILLAANLWVFNWIKASFGVQTSALLIAPIEFVGREKVPDKFGTALAEMVRARLIHVNRELQVLDRLPRGAPLVTGLAEATPSAQLVHVPDLFKTINISAKVGDVDVGGVVSWLAARASEDNVLRITVHEQSLTPAGKLLTVASSASHRASEGLWFDLKDASDTDLVNQIAYALAFEAMQDRMAELEAFTRPEFVTLVGALMDLDILNQKVRLGRVMKPEAYKELLDKLAPLQQTAPKWEGLTEVLAKLAESAQDVVVAQRYYERLIELSGDESRKTSLRAEVKRLKLAATVVAATPATAVAAAYRSPITKLIDLKDPAPASSEIWVFGPGPLAADAASNEFDYADSIRQAILHVLPKAQLKFAGDSVDDGASLARSLTNLANMPALPKVILIPYRISAAGPFAVDVLKRLVARGSVVVVPAGNDKESELWAGTATLPGVAVVGAVNLDGSAAQYSNRGPGVLWAPGTDIPITVGENRRRQSGTGYAGAIAAAVAAILVENDKNLTPAQIVERLRSTSKPALEAANAPKILNVGALLSS